MSEALLTGLPVVLSGALPCFLFAIYAQKTGRYSLFGIWDPSKIANEDAYGLTLCKGVISFSIVVAALGAMMLANFLSHENAARVGVLIALAPSYYKMRKARLLYGK